MLFATGGMLIFPAAGDLLTLFVALEVLSLPLYLLAGMARRRRLLSQEASMKYFLLGAFSSALLLFGIALLYGYSGSLRYSDIATTTQNPTGLDSLLLVGAVLVLSGLLFKVGAVPFHTWTPDVYQGAPTPITGFMAACTKVAAFGALLRIVYTVLPGLQWDLGVVLWTVAILTMVVGTVVALVQTDMKRVLGVLLDRARRVHPHRHHRAQPGRHRRGALLPAGLRRGDRRRVRHRLAGARAVRRRTVRSSARPRTCRSGRAWAARTRCSRLTFALFLLSFAGIPLTAGFVGKFAVFSAAVEGGAWPLALIGVLASAVAAFFYVRIIVLMFFTRARGGRRRGRRRGRTGAVGGGLRARRRRGPRGRDGDRRGDALDGHHRGRRHRGLRRRGDRRVRPRDHRPRRRAVAECSSSSANVATFLP